MRDLADGCEEDYQMEPFLGGALYAYLTKSRVIIHLLNNIRNDEQVVTNYGFGGKIAFDAQDGNFKTTSDNQPGLDKNFED